MYCCTGCGFGPLCLKQGIGIGRDFSDIEDSIIFVLYTHCPDTGIYVIGGNNNSQDNRHAE